MSGGSVHNTEDLPSPFGELGSTQLADSELRETAYEIFVGASRSSGGKPLTYIPQSERADRTPSLSPSPSLSRSLSLTAKSRLKKALGLKKSKKGESDSEGRVKSKRPVTVGELMRIQMKVSEQTDSRIRRALLRISAGQLGRRIDSMVLPLEMLQQIKPSDFANQQEYETWQKRNLKVLEAGLLLHPLISLEKINSSSQRLQQIVSTALQTPIDTVRNNEVMHALRSLVISLASRSFDGSLSETCHWADGYPLNLKLYLLLLEACFDANDLTSIIEEVDEVFELIKKTWVVLGMNQMLHNLCFAWILFHHFVITGQVENDLLFATENLLAEVGKNAKETKDPVYFKILHSVLSSILGWVEKRLFAYHDAFYNDTVDLMQGILSMGILSSKTLVEVASFEHLGKRKEVDVARNKIENYIRSSMRRAFSQASSRKPLSKDHQNFLPVLASLAQDVSELAFNEKEIFSPVLRRWHPFATSVAVATLHACYGTELKRYVQGIDELTPDVVHVLLAADRMEKGLVQIAVEDSVDSEDGGKTIIQEMSPYEAEAVIIGLVKSWVKSRVDRVNEWVHRNLQQEAWNPQANKGHFAPSAVEVLRTIDETLEAFFLLPISMHPLLLPELVTGLDRCLQQYAMKAKSGCGDRSVYVPALPALTRCRGGSKYSAAFKKKEKPHGTQRRSQIGTTDIHNSPGMLQLCVRINTLQHMRQEVELLEKRTVTHLQTSGYHINDIAGHSGKMFELSSAACQEGIQQLCETTAYKVVFHDLSHVLWDGLYVGAVSNSRIEPFLQELEQNLEIVSLTVHDRARTRVITDIMKASFDGLLLVLLAGGPSRAFTQQDSVAIEEDFKFLKELFWSNGDGLPEDLISKHSATIKGVLSLLHTDTESLIERLRNATSERGGHSSKSRLPLPKTSGQWNPLESNTLLRVLCYRNDEKASKFLKKSYNLPTKL